MGLTDEFIEGEFRWIDSDTELTGFKDWVSGNPNNDENEDCVMFWRAHSFLWNDAQCGNRYESVCELG